MMIRVQTESMFRDVAFFAMKGPTAAMGYRFASLRGSPCCGGASRARRGAWPNAAASAFVLAQQLHQLFMVVEQLAAGGWRRGRLSSPQSIQRASQRLPLPVGGVLCRAATRRFCLPHLHAAAASAGGPVGGSAAASAQLRGERGKVGGGRTHRAAAAACRLGERLEGL